MRAMKEHFARSIGRDGAPLHFAAHSHHPWPDVTFEAHRRAWDDAAVLLDRKWSHVFSDVIPKAQAHVARVLNLSDPSNVVFAENTHEFVRRLISCFPLERAPLRVLTTDSEFHSFTRQIDRLAEDGLVDLTRVASEPFDSFHARFAAAASRGGHDLVFFSQVFFNSGFIVPDIGHLVRSVPGDAAFVVVDGYHGFMAVPTDLRAFEGRAFYIAGGYKYAMAGEGACFMHCPPRFGARPRDTGWYAEFGALGQARENHVCYGRDASRFASSTFDPSGLYRLNAVMDWIGAHDLTVGACHAYCLALQEHFLDRLGGGAVRKDQLLVQALSSRGRFLTFRVADAERIDKALDAKNIIVDRRGDRLRFGFGIYHDVGDVERLIEALKAVA